MTSSRLANVCQSGHTSANRAQTAHHLNKTIPSNRGARPVVCLRHDLRRRAQLGRYRAAVTDRAGLVPTKLPRSLPLSRCLENIAHASLPTVMIAIMPHKFARE